jgi:hypothetical protein
LNSKLKAWNFSYTPSQKEEKTNMSKENEKPY